MTRSDFVRTAVKVAAAAALVGGLGLATGCASVPLKAWQNGAAMSSNDVLYGGQSVRSRTAYRSYLEMNSRGIRMSPPSAFAPLPSHFYW